MSELASGKSDVEERLKKLEDKLLSDRGGAGSGGTGGAHRPNFKVKCENCEWEKKFCRHCTECGESGHSRKDCSKN